MAEHLSPLEEAPETETLAESAPAVEPPGRRAPVERTASAAPRPTSEALQSRVVAAVTDRGRLLVRRVDGGEGSAPNDAIVKPLESVHPDPATVAPSFRQPGDPEQSQTRANPPPRRSASTPTATHDRPASSGNTVSHFSTKTPEAYGVQAKLTVRQPGDRFEREADAVARAVGTGSAAPAISTLPATRTGTAQRIGPRSTPTERVRDSVSPSTTRTIRHPGPGRPVPDSVRRSIEPTLETSLADVQVHDGSRAAAAAGRMGARAFTHDNHIFLGRGESAADVDLMAHEATHVVQQQGAPTVQRLLDLSLDDLPGIDAADIARRVPGFTLFTVILGYNPITNESVEFTGPNLIQGLFELVPFGADIYDALAEQGIVGDAFAWIQENMPDVSTERLTGLLEEAWDEMGITLSPAENIDVLISTFRPVARELEAFGDRAVDKVIEFVKEVAIGTAEGLLDENRAWDLIKKILGRDPLRDETVEAEPAEILEDFLLLIGKEEHLEQMRERGTVEETAQWLVTQLETFQSLLGRLRGLIESAWEALQPENLSSLATNIETLGEEVGTFLQDVWTFASTVAAEVLARIKDALLGWLSDYATDIPGFHLLTVILGRNPFTEEPVPRTAENLIRGFITLLPGGAAIYQQLAETGVIGEAAGRIEGALESLGITWDFVVGLFTGIWERLSIESLADPVGTFAMIVEQFGEPITRLFAFVNVVLRELFTVLLALMNFPTDLVGSIISNAMQAITDIRADPVGCLQNMLAAVKLGFQNFFGNILTHLAGGLADWLFRGLRDAGLEPPADLSLESVLGFVMEVLGISTDRLWEKLGERIGEENVERIQGAIDRLTGIWEFVADVRERGITAIWEYIASQITGLWDMVLEKAQEWIMERVINRAIQWLLSLLDPTGIMAVVNSFVAFFNAIQSAVEYLRDILAIVDDYVSTLAAVASGSLEAGAAMLEKGLANVIPVAIGFLANQLGLGDIGEKIAEIVAGIRGVVDRALDWLIDRAVSSVESMLQAIGLGSSTQETSPVHGDDEVDATDHSAVVESVIQELETLETSEFDSTRAAAEERAGDLETYWSTRLESGIGLTVTFTPLEEDRSDTDIDFTVVVAPNDTEGSGSVTVDEETTESAFVGRRVPEVEQELVDAGYVRPYRLESGTWVIRVPSGNPDGLPRLSTEADGITIRLASSRRESSPVGEVFFDPANYVPPPAGVRELFKSRVFEGEYVLMRSRYTAGLPRTKPDSKEARQDVESLITGEPARESRSQLEADADEILRNAGDDPDTSMGEDFYDLGERLTYSESDTGEFVPTRDAVTIENTTAMSLGLTQEFLDAWFANGGWPPHWQVDHAQEVRFGGNDTITNYAPLPLPDHQKKSSWAAELARAVLEDPEIRAAFYGLETAEARGVNFEP